MSVDLFIYSAQPKPPDRSTLEKALAKKGWHACFLDEGSLKALSGGRVGDDLIYGSRDAKILKRALDLLGKNDQRALEALFEEDPVGGCGLSVTCPFDFQEEHGGELPEGIPSKLANQITKAKSHYDVCTSAGRSDTGIALQMAVWESLGELVDGLLEDPQSGEFSKMGSKGRKILVGADEGEGSAIDLLKTYVKAAKWANFPVQMTKDGFDLHPEKLSRAELERLFKFTSEHFGTGNLEGAALLMMTLEEFKKRKGKAYLRDNAKWLAQLGEKYADLS